MDNLKKYKLLSEEIFNSIKNKLSENQTDEFSENKLAFIIQLIVLNLIMEKKPTEEEIAGIIRFFCASILGLSLVFNRI